MKTKYFCGYRIIFKSFVLLFSGLSMMFVARSPAVPFNILLEDITKDELDNITLFDDSVYKSDILYPKVGSNEALKTSSCYLTIFTENLDIYIVLMHTNVIIIMIIHHVMLTWMLMSRKTVF